jgi:hypothetical protein
MQWHLAQINVGRLHAPIDDPRIAEFVGGLDAINSLADVSAGFVWRLQTKDGDATDLRISPDERVIVNVSVWESIEALSDFVYRSGHVAFLRRRREWFEEFGNTSVAMWWVPAGHLPDLEEAVTRLALLEALGSTPDAFPLRDPHSPPEHRTPPTRSDDGPR